MKKNIIKPVTQHENLEKKAVRIFSFEEVRNTAHNIYLNRIRKGIFSSSEQGSPEQDWYKAKAISELQAMGF